MTPISTFNDHILSTEHVDYYYGFTRDTALFDQVDISHVKTVYSDILSGKKVNVSEKRGPIFKFFLFFKLILARMGVVV